MHRTVLAAASVAVVLAGVLASTSSQAATQGRWVIRDLGTLGGDESWAADINESGQVVGGADTGATVPDFEIPISHAFLWQNGKMRDLGTLGGEESWANAVNDRGQIVGTSEYRAALWQKGKVRYLSRGLEASDINNRGQVVGVSPTGASDTFDKPIVRAFLWQDGTMRTIGTLGPLEDGVGANAVNGHGQVVGARSTSGGLHAFLWQSGKMRDLGRLGGEWSEARAINDRGVIVGVVDNRAVLWEKGKAQKLAGSSSEALDINNRGQVVGWADTKAAGHAFLWENGKMTDLGTLAGGRESGAAAINERGEVVGWSETRSGPEHAVLWTYKP